jgi:hypothetical protein
MKNYLLLLVMSATLILSCSKDDDNSSSISPGNVSNTLSNGTWRITYYWDTDHEETSDFSGYSFTFGSNSVLTATKTGSTVTGTWSTGTDDSKTELIIAFASPASFVEISDDWEVIEMTDTKIRLRDVSGGNGGTDQLTFEKN